MLRTPTLYDITGLTTESVLAALYNAAVQICNDPNAPSVMTAEQAFQVLGEWPITANWSFDYLYGRALKVGLGLEPRQKLDLSAYDSRNGTGTGATALAILRETKNPQHPHIINLHQYHTDMFRMKSAAVQLLYAMTDDELAASLRIRP